MSESGEEEINLSDETVVNTYRRCGDVVNRVLQTLIEKCVVGASVRTLCIEGDQLILDTLKVAFRKDKELKKGIAFPVCISVDNCVNHYSPMTSDNDTILKEGDLVKIDLGAHADELIAVAAHTIIVGATKENKITGRKADVILAAHYAAEAASRLVKSGNQNFTVTDTIMKVAKAYDCKPIEGMLSFQLERGRIDGEKAIIQNPTEGQRKEIEKVNFEVNDVFGIDVLISTGQGVSREMEARTTIYKKTDEVYQLKLKTSREFYTKVQRNHGTMPFNIRSFDEEKKARMGVMECVTHRLVEPYPVLYEKANEYVAQFKFTVMLTPKGAQRITGLKFDVDALQSEFQIEDEELKKLLTAKSTYKKKKKPSKKSANPESSTAEKPATPSKVAETPKSAEAPKTVTPPKAAETKKAATPSKSDKQTTPTKAQAPAKPKTPEAAKSS